MHAQPGRWKATKGQSPHSSPHNPPPPPSPPLLPLIKHAKTLIGCHVILLFNLARLS